MAKPDFGMTAHYFSDLKEVIGRDVSIKYNGHSVIWDGGITRGKIAENIPWYYKHKDRDGLKATGLWTLGRKGVCKVVPAPDWWINMLPVGVPLHGEVWKDDDLQFIKKWIKKGNPNMWKNIKFKVFYVKPYETFGCIKDTGKNEFYSNRKSIHTLFERARSLVPENEVLQFVQQHRINSKPQALEWFEKYEKSSWEGLMFRDPNGHYENKRSKACLKYKPTYEDEAEVLGYLVSDAESKKGLPKSIHVRYTVHDDKFKHLCGYKPSYIGKTVEFYVSGLSASMGEHDWDILKEKYPVGGKITFGFKMFSENGVPQSPNIFRGN